MPRDNFNIFFEKMWFNMKYIVKNLILIPMDCTLYEWRIQRSHYTQLYMYRYLKDIFFILNFQI